MTEPGYETSSLSVHVKLTNTNDQYADVTVAVELLPGDCIPDVLLVRWTVVSMSQTYDGGMREFHDPIRDETVGCAGLHFAERFVRPLEGWAPEPDDALAWEAIL